MKRALRALRPTGPGVASCDVHLPDAMRAVTPERDGDENDTHVVVRRLPADTTLVCELGRHQAKRQTAPAVWLLTPQAVLR